MSNNTTPVGSQQAPALIDSFQPTVRVMRLYKPGFHLTQSFPHMPQTFSENAVEFNKAGGPDFTMSPYLLLPDSFGDIYAGEKFSAYIAVVNGFTQVPFYQVTLAVRLQTSTTVIDLADTRSQIDMAGTVSSKTLSCNDTFDMIVAQTLNELGIHTLRVSVQYLLTPTSEVKTLRKFYRFNVLQPLVITSSYVELNGKPMVQCEVTNATKSPIYIDELSYIPTNRSSVCVPISALGEINSTGPETVVLSDSALSEDLKLLPPTESIAFAFMFTEYSDLSGRPPGFPQVKWCTSMGEFSYYRGDFTYSKSASNPAQEGLDQANNPIRYECFTRLTEMHVGDENEVTIRVFNTTANAMSVHLDCKNSVAPPAVVAAASSARSSTIRPRLSVHQNANVSSERVSGDTGGNLAASTNRGLCFSGLTFTPLGIIESLDFVDVTVNVYATSSGLHDLPTFYIIDSITNDRHAVVAACRVLVLDSEEWLEDGEAETEAAFGSPEETNDTAPELIAEMLAELPPALAMTTTVIHSPNEHLVATPLSPPAPPTLAAESLPVRPEAPPAEDQSDAAVLESDLLPLQDPELPILLDDLRISDAGALSPPQTSDPHGQLSPVLSEANLSGHVMSELEIGGGTEAVDAPASPKQLTAASSSAELASSMSRFFEESELEIEQMLGESSVNSSTKSPLPESYELEI